MPTFSCALTPPPPARSRRSSEQGENADLSRRYQSGTNFGFADVGRFAKRLISLSGWVAEWFKAPVLKTGVGSRPPGVRIPPHPPATPNGSFGIPEFFATLRPLS